MNETTTEKIDAALALINAFVRAYITDSNVFHPVNGGFISL